MPANDVLVVTERSPFENAFENHSWEWLLTLGRRLSVDLQVVNATLIPLIGLGAGANTVSALIKSEAPDLRRAVSIVMRTKNSQTLVIDRGVVACMPLRLGSAIGGA